MSRLAQLRTTIEQNKRGIAIAGAVGVAGLALVNKSRGGDEPAAAGEDGPTSGSQYGLAPMPATGQPYDSSASDVYNAIQPQIESVGQKQNALEELLNKTLEKISQTPIPVAAPPPPAPVHHAPAPQAAAAPQPRVYVVQAGDNLTKIARNLGLGGWQGLYNSNRGVIGGNPNLIRPGQRLVY